MAGATGSASTGMTRIGGSAAKAAERAGRAVDDVASTTAGTPVVVHVLANDRNVPSESRVSVVTGPGSGSTTVGRDGAVTYVPRAGSTGTDRFTYVVTTSAGTGRAEVEVVVRPAQAVVAMDDEVLTTPRRPVVVDVRANDVGADELHVVLTGDYGSWVGRWEPGSLPPGQPLREPAPLFEKLDAERVVEDELARLEAAAAA